MPLSPAFVRGFFIGATMTNEVAGLAIKIDSTDATKAAENLDKVTAAGEKTEGAAKKVQRSWEQAIERVAAEANGLNSKFDTLNSTQARMLAAVERIAAQMDRMSASMDKAAGRTNSMAQAAVKTTESLNKVDRAAATAATGMNSAAAGADKATRSMKSQDAAASKLTSTLQNYARIAVGAFGVREIVRAADAWQGLENRLRLVTDGQQELAQATDAVFGIAQRTSQGVDSVAQVYQRFAQNADTLGVSQREVAQLTETVGKAIAVSGGSAAAAEGALQQFGQALGSGVLRGEEFNSVMEGAPGLAQALAVGLGVPVGALREMAAQGKITGDVIVESLIKAQASVDGQFGTRVETIGQAFTKLENSLTKFIGQASKASGASSTIANSLGFVADNLDAVVTLAGTLIGMRLAAWLTAVAASATAGATGFTAATVAVRGFFAALGPIGWAVLAIGSAATAWELFGKSATQAANDLDDAAGKSGAAARRASLEVSEALKDLIAEYEKAAAARRRAFGLDDDPIGASQKQYDVEAKRVKALGVQYAQAVAASGTGVEGNAESLIAATKARTEAAELMAEIEKSTSKMLELDAVLKQGMAGRYDEYISESFRMSKGEQQAQDIWKANVAFQRAVEGVEEGTDQYALALQRRNTELKRINDRYKDKQTGGMKDLLASLGLSGIENELAKQVAAIEASTGALETVYQRGDMSTRTYYTQRIALAEQSAAAQESAIQREIQALAGLNASGKNGQQVRERLAAAETKLVIARAKNSSEVAALREQEAAYFRGPSTTNIRVIEDQERALLEQNRALQEQIDFFGRTASEMELLRVARIDATIAQQQAILVMAEEKGAAADEIRAIQDRIQALNGLREARQESAGLLATHEDQQKAQERINANVQQWSRGIDKIGDLFIEGFSASLDENENAFDAFVDNAGKSLKNALATAFYEATVRPVVVKFVAQMAGMLGGQGVADGILKQAGLGGSKSGVPGGGNLLGSAANYMTGMSVGAGASAAAGGSLAYANWAGAAGGDAIGALIGANTAWTSSANAVTGAIGSAMGAVGSALPWIGAGVMAYSLLKDSFKGETRFGAGYTIDQSTGLANRSGGPSGGDQNSKASADAIGAMWSTTNQLAGLMGGSTAGLGFAGGLEISPEKGNSFVWSDWVQEGEANDYKRGMRSLSGVKDGETVAAEFAVELQRAVIDGLKLSSLDKEFADYLNQFNTDALDAAGVEAVLANLNAMAQFRDVLTRLPFADLAGLALDAGLKMAEYSGGMDALLGNMQVYYDLVYSEQEKAEHLQAKLVESFRSLGYELPDSVAGLRSLVEGLDTTTDAGLKARAEIYALTGSFGQLQDMLASLGGTVVDVVAEANAAFEAQLAKVKDLAAESQRLLGARNAAGGVLDQIDRGLGKTGQFALQREAELRAALVTAGYEDQAELAGELAAITLDRIQAEIAANERLLDLSKGIHSYVSGLKISDMSPLTLGERLAEAGSQYADMLARAQGGDVDAMGRLQGMASSYLDLARQYYASSDQYTQIFDSVTGGLDALGVQAQSDAERQTAIGADSLAQLEQLRDIAQGAYTALDQQYQHSLGALAQETSLLTSLGMDTGRLHDIAGLLGSMPAEIAARLQPMLDAATGATVGGWYQDAGRGQGDQAGLDFWQGQLGSKPADQVKDDFNWGIVADWYRSELGREGSAGDIAFWAEEAKVRGVAAAYQDFLWGAQREMDGSHRDGLGYVPFDGYRAELHQGERVLTANENRAYQAMPSWSSFGQGSDALITEVRALRASNEKLVAEVKLLREQNNQGLAMNIQATEQSGKAAAKGAIDAQREAEFTRKNAPVTA